MKSAFPCRKQHNRAAERLQGLGARKVGTVHPFAGPECPAGDI
jgi:hypothetical protein